MPLIRAHIPHKIATVSTVSIGEIHKIIPNKIEIIPLIIKNIFQYGNKSAFCQLKTKTSVQERRSKTSKEDLRKS